MIGRARTWAAAVVGRVVVWWLDRRGYDVVDKESLQDARDALMGCRSYVNRSGHLNTVSGRRPRAVGRVTDALDRAVVLTVPDRRPA